MSKYIIGNLKMNLVSSSEVERYFSFFKNEAKGKIIRNVKIIICPPFIHIKSFAKELKSKNVDIGAQNTFWEKKGPYTGEISPLMIKNFGGEYVIVGHSERRKYFSETNEIINFKIKSVIKERMSVIFCFGETLEERGMGLTSKTIIDQLQEGLKDVNSSGLEKIIFAYEPVWAVGTDSIPTSNGIMEIKILIRKILAAKYGLKYSQKAIILYGGSVKTKNMNQLCLSPGMDGVLVGQESLDPYEFLKIAEMLSN